MHFSFFLPGQLYVTDWFSCTQNINTYVNLDLDKYLSIVVIFFILSYHWIN